MRKRYVVRLSPEERDDLHQLVSAGREKARKLAHARILLKADECWTDKSIHQALDVSMPTVARVRRRFFEEGLRAALDRRPPNRVYHRKLDGSAEAHLIALACSQPPEGRSRWTLRLLSDRLVTLEQVEIDSVSYQTVRRVLIKRTQAVADQAMGNPTEGQPSFRLPYGGRSGPLPPAL